MDLFRKIGHLEYDTYDCLSIGIDIVGIGLQQMIISREEDVEPNLTLSVNAFFTRVKRCGREGLVDYNRIGGNPS